MTTLSQLTDDQLWEVISARRTAVIAASGVEAERKLKEAMNEWDARVCEREWYKRVYGGMVS